VYYATLKSRNRRHAGDGNVITRVRSNGRHVTGLDLVAVPEVTQRTV